ncbi:MAG: hypothetical protein KIT84_38695 [Labilithrix sp.]|nr:hypothetical protein [Labilithrix sp.]MCW5816990.1 hypothetical protein [Labilithrix sp.]
MHSITHAVSKRLFGVAALVVLLGVGACQKKEDRWEQAAASAQKAAESAPTSSAPKAETGSFNKFFPPDGTEGASRVFTADKEGYAEAKLSKDGKEIALLAVTDLNGKDADKKKFEGAADKVDAHPVATFGKNKTMILVKDRYQVSVSSQSLDHDARKGVISKFDLRGLSAL